MALPEGQVSDEASQSMDVDSPLDGDMCESQDLVYVGQGNLVKVAASDTEGNTRRATSSRRTNGPLPDQKDAFHDALRLFPGASPSRSSDCADQEKQATATVDDSHSGCHSASSRCKTKLPLADQEVAFHKALQLLTGDTPKLRGGSSYHADQENYARVLLDNSNSNTQPSISSRKTNVPLADQTAAFYAALQQSTGAALTSSGALTEQSAKNDAVLAAERQAKLRNKNAAKKQKRQKKRQRRQWEQEQQEGSVG
ncbi:MAG: hypothetical protein Q9184_004343 [Pyrenodesmia sp. 2 TL-2023]